MKSKIPYLTGGLRAVESRAADSAPIKLREALEHAPSRHRPSFVAPGLGHTLAL